MNVRVNSRISSSNKTISTGSGHDGLTGALKDALKEDNWHVIVKSQERRVKGQLGQKTDLSVGRAVETQYDLDYEWTQVDFDLSDWSPLYRFTISIIDNETREEIVTMNGLKSERRIKRSFLEAIRRAESL